MEALSQVELLLVIEAEIATTHLIEQILSSLAARRVSYRKKILTDLSESDFCSTSLPIFIRCADPMVAYWVALMNDRRIPYVYYVDDNFWKIEGDSLLAKYYQHPIIRSTLQMVVSHAYCVFTSSGVLSIFLQQFNKNIKVLPPPFSFELIEGVRPEVTSEVRIGFAGSPSRVRDLDIIAPIARPILDKYPDVIFEFVGVKPDGLASDNRLRFFPHCDSYVDYIQFQVRRGWAIGLAPLYDTEANRSKTNNKYREYAACGIAGIYTDMPPYAGSVIPGNSGLLVKNYSTAWMDAVETLMNSPHLRRQIARTAYADVLQKHSMQAIGSVWFDALIEANKALQERRLSELNLGHSPLIFEKLRAWRSQIRLIWFQIWLTQKEGGLPLVVSRSYSRLRRTFAPKRY